MTVGKRVILGLIVAVCLLGILVSVTPSHQIAAQERSIAIDRLAIGPVEDGIVLYNVDAAGQFTYLTTLDDLQIGWFADYGNWVIMLPETITTSPDGRYVAFTAVRELPTELFIYSVTENSLSRFDAPGQGRLQWSPDSASLLLSPGGGWDSTPDLFVYLPDIYRFDLATNQFTRLTVTTEREWMVEWLPKDEEFLFSSGTKLYRMDRDGQQELVMDTADISLGYTYFDAFYAYSYCGVRDITLQPTTARLYTLIACSYAEYTSDDFLYSIDRYGNVREELNMHGLDLNLERASIVGMYPSGNSQDIIVLVNGITYTDDDPYVEFWEVYRLSESGGRTVQASFFPDDDFGSRFVETSDLSSDERFLAVGETNFYNDHFALHILDLTRRQTMTFAVDGRPCQIEWLDNQYIQVVTDQNCVQQHLPDGSWLLDTSTGDIQQITGGLDGYVWVLPQPDIAPNNFSPYANAGPDQMAFLETPIRLDASQSLDPDGQIVTYQWRRDGVIIADGVNPTIFLPLGQQTLTLTVIDDDGAIGRDQVRIFVR